MIRHYLNTLIRNLLKHKAFSMINILGLALGITCCLLLCLLIRNELSIDRNFPGEGKIYRVTSTLIPASGEPRILPRTSPPIGPVIHSELPQIESMTRVVRELGVEKHILRYGEQFVFVSTGLMVDSAFFNVFEFPFLAGNAATALSKPQSVVITENVARSLFGDQPALDQLLLIPTFSPDQPFKVTGILDRRTEQSHLDADIYVSGLEGRLQSITTWASANFVFTYVRLRPDANISDVSSQLPTLMKKYGDEENRQMGRQKVLGMQPLGDVHLYSTEFDHTNDLGKSGSATYLNLIALIGVLIMALAGINYVNLTTARSSQRSGEIGIRKSMGASTIQLRGQFLGESISLTLIGGFIAIIVTMLTLPWFNQLTGKSIVISIDTMLFMLGLLCAISVVTAVLAGAYPAWILSSISAINGLRQKSVRSGSGPIRKALLIMQFAVSVTLVASIFIIQEQLQFLQNKPLGFDDSSVMIPLRTPQAIMNYPQFKSMAREIGGVRSVTASSNLPSTPPTSDWSFYPAGKEPGEAASHYIIYVDEDYFEGMSIPLIAGRDFSFPIQEVPDRPKGVIVNQASLRAMGLTVENAISHQLSSPRSNDSYEIIGVVEDFHQYSLHQPIGPLVFFPSLSGYDFNYSLVSISAANSEEMIGKLRDAWKVAIPEVPFESTLLSDRVQSQYESDKSISEIVSASSVIACVISSLGLYGLSIFIAERKKKEIGIRKVLGASTASIVVYLLRSIIGVMLVAITIGSALGFFAMDRWLSTFAYKIDIGLLSFVIAGVLDILIGVAVFSFKSIGAASSNPVDVIRSS